MLVESTSPCVCMLVSTSQQSVLRAQTRRGRQQSDPQLFYKEQEPSARRLHLEAEVPAQRQVPQPFRVCLSGAHSHSDP